MPRHTYGEPVGEDDVLEIQGVDYPMMPVGMRAMRRLLTLRSQVDLNRTEDDPMTEADLDLMIDIVTGCVRPDYRDRLKEHIEESIPPNLLIVIATNVMRSFSDLDPTALASSSPGSTSTGSASMDGAPAAELTPAT